MSPCVGASGWILPDDLLLLGAALPAVGEEVVGIARAHQPRARERQRHARGVDGDPAPAPLLGDSSRGAGAAGRIEHEIAGIGGHQDAALDYLSASLNHIDLFVSKAASTCVIPDIVDWRHGKIVKIRVRI